MWDEPLCYFWSAMAFASELSHGCRFCPVSCLLLIMNTRGAMDRRWSVLRTYQSPQFGTHVISGLTDTFIHQRVKVYHLHVFYLAKVESGLTHRFLRSAAATHTEAHTLSEREVRFRYRVSDNVSTDGYIHTHKVMLKYPFWQVFW